MSFDWIHENAPQWDAPKEKIIGDAPAGSIHGLGNYRDGDVIPGEWWRAEEGGQVLGYGWMDTNWGDAEILLAVDPAQHRRGVGSFILENLAREAAQRGMNYMYNVVGAKHPERDGITKWLSARGFERSHDDESLRRRIRPQAT